MEFITTSAVDLSASADTTAWTMEAPRAGKVHLNLCYGRVAEEISTPATNGVTSLEIGGTEYGTMTATDSDAVGETYTVTEAAAVGEDAVVYFSAGDDIAVKTKTQAAGGGGQDGTIEWHLAITWADV